LKKESRSSAPAFSMEQAFSACPLHFFSTGDQQRGSLGLLLIAATAALADGPSTRRH